MNQISVIVPIYNVEKYLSECIESILQYDFFEVILIDDGSTDGSGKICDKYAAKNKNVIVIHQKNKGLSGARNSGIKKATGNYLMFVDSDDLLNSKVNFDEIVDNNTDIIAYKWKYFYEDRNQYRTINDYEGYNELNYFNTLEKMAQTGQMAISAWSKIVKRKIIIDNNLYFKEGLLSEDVDWSMRLYLVAKSLTLINEEIYIYRQGRPNSITSTKSRRTIDSLFYIIDKWYNYTYRNKQTKNIYYSYIAYWYLILLTTIDQKEDKEKAAKYRDLLKYNENYKVKKTTTLMKFFGVKATVLILKLYKQLHRKGVISL